MSYALWRSGWQQAVRAARPSHVKEEANIQWFLQATCILLWRKSNQDITWLGTLIFALIGIDYLPGHGLLLGVLKTRANRYFSHTRLVASSITLHSDQGSLWLTQFSQIGDLVRDAWKLLRCFTNDSDSEIQGRGECALEENRYRRNCW